MNTVKDTYDTEVLNKNYWALLLLLFASLCKQVLYFMNRNDDKNM